MVDTRRCSWVSDSTIYREYHDHEWGVPAHDDTQLFEMLTLEGAQAGLSWLTILKRREGYRKAFDGFAIDSVVRFTEEKKNNLLANTEIIRNRLKISSVIKNAAVITELQKEYGSFDEYIWSFTQGAVIPYVKRSHAVDISVVMSINLKKRGCTFVGPTICYAFMQAIGMVNDHEPECFLYKVLD